MVTWKTSDPVSGTVVSYTNDGTANTGFVSEQTEPLGQGISLEPPPVEPEPPTYEAHLFDAYDPEWQCSDEARDYYGSFSGLPEHCQRKRLYAAGIDLPWTNEYSVKLIVSYPEHSSHEATHQGFGASKALKAENDLRMAALFSSGKNNKSSGSGVSAFGCTFDSGVDCTVPSLPFDSALPIDIAQRLDAGNGGDLIGLAWAIASAIENLPNTLRSLIEDARAQIRSRIHCLPVVSNQIEKMQTLYNLNRSANRAVSLSTEMAFAILYVDGEVRVTGITISHERHNVKLKLPAGTFAWVHSHPNGVFPSPEDIEAGKQHGLRTYVLGPGGLTVFDPSAPLDKDGKVPKKHAQDCDK